MQRTEQSSSGAGKPSGVPGTASNTPAAAANGAVQGSAAAAAPGTPPLLQKDPVYPQGSGQNQTVKEESGTYAVSKHTTHLEMGPGRVGRVTAAVLVNDRLATEGAGKLLHTVWKPRSPDEMRRLEELAQAAVGYDQKRGDLVVIQNMSFSANSPEVPAPLLDRDTEQAKGFLHTQPNLFRTLVLGVCGVLLVMFVLRPVARQVTATLKEPVLLAASPEHSLDESQMALAADHAMAEDAIEMEPPRQFAAPVEPPRAVPRRGATSTQAMFDSVADHIREDSVQSTRVLQSWIASDERAG